MSTLLLGFIFLPYHQFYFREVYKKKKENMFFSQQKLPVLIEAGDFQATGSQKAQ